MDFAAFHHAHFNTNMQVYQYSPKHWVVRMDKEDQGDDFFLWTYDRPTATAECTHSSTREVVARLRHNAITFHLDSCLLSRKYVDVLAASVFFLRHGLQPEDSNLDTIEEEEVLFV
jgi:hypothetical protein